MLAFITTLLTITSLVSGNLMDRLNLFRYTTFQVPISWEKIMSSGLEMALKHCQESTKWERWNCPSSDFYARLTSRPQRPEREDIYVAAITTAAILYTISSECATGRFLDCACTEKAGEHCAPDPFKAVELFEQHFSESKQYAIPGLSNHNQMAISTLLEQSVTEQCHDRLCSQTQKPFAEIALSIRHMYDDAIQLGASGDNLKIIWENIPLDTLIYVRDSRNYCEPDSAQWPGTRGRQCSKTGSTVDERQSCTELCRSCGYRVRTHHARSEHRCNCKVIWGFQISCDVCVHVERQYYCY